MNTKLATIALILSICCAPLVTAQSGPPDQGGAGLCVQALTEHLEQLPVRDLGEEEVAAVSFLREEEKLARDVYLVLSLRWQTPIFTQIARSEQRHMDLVGVLLARHEISDPATDDTIGAFSDPQLTALYDQLTERGQRSFVDALLVGATIEDLDLADLAAIHGQSDELDTWLIVENLARGSRNHLRSFANALAVNGWSYAAQYLDPAVVSDIISSDPERGVVYDEFGDILAECGAQGGNGGGSGDGNGNGGGNGGGNSGGGVGDGPGSGTCDGTGPNGN